MRLPLATAALLWSLVAAGQERVERYPGGRDVSLSPGLEAAGERFDAAYFTTPDSPEEVAAYYARRWEAAGLPISVEGDGATAVVVSAFLTREARQLAVVLQRHGTLTLGFRIERALPQLAPARTPSPPLAEARELSLAAGSRLAFFPEAPEAVWRRRVAYWERQGFSRVAGAAFGLTLLVRARARVQLMLSTPAPGWTAVVEQRSEGEEH